MKNPFYSATATENGVTLTLNRCAFGSRTGDTFLDISANNTRESVQQKISDCVEITHISFTSHALDIRSIDQGTQHPCVWISTHDAMRSLSKEFSRMARPYSIKKDCLHLKTELPVDGRFVIPDDDDPRERQLVLDMTADRLNLYIQSTIGHPAHNGHGAQWYIHRSPCFEIKREGLAKIWQNVAKAIVFESTGRERPHPEYYQPFDQVLAQNPNCEWICSY